MWIITKDIIGGGLGNGIRSTNCPDNLSKSEIEEKMPHKFRLYDDDRELYFEGFSSDCETEEAFAPLDDFGEGGYGCTYMKYLINGNWEIL